MTKNTKEYRCKRCRRAITEEEYETHSGSCKECHETEIDELDYEDEYVWLTVYPWLKQKKKTHCENCGTELNKDEIQEIDWMLLCWDYYNEEDLRTIDEEWIE